MLGVELVIIARTDALSATFIDTNIDPLDHPYILGQVDPSQPDISMTFPEAGLKDIADKYPAVLSFEIIKRLSQIAQIKNKISHFETEVA